MKKFKYLYIESVNCWSCKLSNITTMSCNYRLHVFKQRSFQHNVLPWERKTRLTCGEEKRTCNMSRTEGEGGVPCLLLHSCRSQFPGYCLKQVVVYERFKFWLGKIGHFGKVVGECTVTVVTRGSHQIGLYVNQFDVYEPVYRSQLAC